MANNHLVGCEHQIKRLSENIDVSLIVFRIDFNAY